MSVAIDISVEADCWTRLPDAESVIRSAAAATLADNAAAEAEIGVVLTDDRRIRELNLTWRGIDAPTNVLSFPAPAEPSGPRFLGDVAFALETLEREATAEGKPLRDHLAHLTVHGVLHLLGFDHERDDDAEAMEARERAILNRLGIADPYAMPEPNAMEPT